MKKINRINSPKKKEKRKNSYLFIVLGLVLFLMAYVYQKFSSAEDMVFFISFILGLALFYVGLFSLVRKPYATSWRYMKESKNYIYFSVLLFVFSALVGFIFFKNFSFIDLLLKDLIEKTLGLNAPEMIKFIFFNNLQVSFIGLFLGIAFGIFPFINLISNGIVLGYVFRKVGDVAGIGEFWRILPHGIFELPAVFISLGLGLKLGTVILSKNKGELKRRFDSSWKVFLFVVVPLLILAAIIEGTLIVFSN